VRNHTADSSGRLRPVPVKTQPVACESFECVAALDTDSQLYLLQSGDPVERVWSAWSLGLTLGSGAIPHLIDCFQNRTSSTGTRRHLLVVLAGLGERSLLFGAAEQDPDALIRATACDYLLKTAKPGDERTRKFLQGRLAAEEAEPVRRTILRNFQQRP
jgi:hypothetical protein